MGDVKEGPNGIALSRKEGNGSADTIDRLLRPVVREEQNHGEITL